MPRTSHAFDTCRYAVPAADRERFEKAVESIEAASSTANDGSIDGVWRYERVFFTDPAKLVNAQHTEETSGRNTPPMLNNEPPPRVCRLEQRIGDMVITLPVRMNKVSISIPNC